MAGLEIRGFAVKFLVSLILALALFTPGLAHAESFVVERPAPKGVVGFDGVKCIGEADYNGNHYRFVAYEGADADEMASDSGRERKWQENSCRRILYNDQVYGSMATWIKRGYDGSLCLLWHPGARLRGVDEPEDLYCYVMPPAPDFDPSTIKMTIERV